MKITERIEKLERDASSLEPFRVVYTPDGIDKEAELIRQRQVDRYRGPLVIMDETDRNL
ncbi:hypothetical protein [Rhodanobacter sp. L36]|uniref:hypothetical protein n=1 Tax=Rhodanobacter sp. L36 TaxID=1747221 RepID=UPI00131B77C9|nr:hypothetical protein [Rhodanobacter sp. L36]